jgi:hypothetical protein
MTLRPRPKGIENLRLANLRDYIITEDEGEVSPRTTHPARRTRALPRRINLNDDTVEDIMYAFRRFTWETPKVDGRVLYNYRRFVTAMAVPTKEAIEPWVEWIEIQLGWERDWILDNPVATKREIMRRFEGEDPVEHERRATGWWDEHHLFDEPYSKPTALQQLSDDTRGGAISRIGFRDGEVEQKEASARTSLRLRRLRELDRPETRLGNHVDEDEGEKVCDDMGKGWTARQPNRPMSSLGFRELRTFKRQIATLKKKALTNPWQRRKNLDKSNDP